MSMLRRRLRHAALPLLLLLLSSTIQTPLAAESDEECSSLLSVRVTCVGTTPPYNGLDCNSVPARTNPVDCESKVRYAYSLIYTGETYGAAFVSAQRYRYGSFNGFGAERSYLMQMEGQDLVQGTAWDATEEICEDSRADTTLEVKVQVHGSGELCTVSDVYEHDEPYGDGVGGGPEPTEPTDEPVARPTDEPTPAPQRTDEPTSSKPTGTPSTDEPTRRPTADPTITNTNEPTSRAPVSSTSAPTSPAVSSTSEPTTTGEQPTGTPTESAVDIGTPPSASSGGGVAAGGGCSISLGIRCATASSAPIDCDQYAPLAGKGAAPCSTTVKFSYTAQNVGTGAAAAMSARGAQGEITFTKLERSRTDAPDLDFLRYYSSDGGDALVLGLPPRNDLAIVTENVEIDFCDLLASGSGGEADDSETYRTTFAAAATSGSDGDECEESVEHCLGVGCDDGDGDGDGDGGTDGAAVDLTGPSDDADVTVTVEESESSASARLDGARLAGAAAGAVYSLVSAYLFLVM